MIILIYNNLNNNSQCYQTDGLITAGGGGGGEGRGGYEQGCTVHKLL